jgi:hypothetical protein
MVNKINIFLILLFFYSTSFPQVENIRDWLGEWKTTYTNNFNEKTEEFLIIELIHSGSWVHFIDSGTVFSEPELKWTSSYFLTLDNELKVIGFYIDDNGYDGMSTIKGVFEDNRLILKSESQMSSCKDTWELKNGKLFLKSIYKSKESGKTDTLEHIYTKKP